MVLRGLVFWVTLPTMSSCVASLMRIHADSKPHLGMSYMLNSKPKLVEQTNTIDIPLLHMQGTLDRECRDGLDAHAACSVAINKPT